MTKKFIVSIQLSPSYKKEIHLQSPIDKSMTAWYKNNFTHKSSVKLRIEGETVRKQNTRITHCLFVESEDFYTQILDP